MTWSLALKNGDITASGSAGYQVVTGPQKLMQDVRNWMLEPQGSDPMHPEYGSNLDGGLMPDGSMIPSLIGAANDKEHLASLESELNRIVFAYQNLQLQRLTREQYELDGKNTFAPGELLWSVSIGLQQFQDIVLAAIAMTSNNGQTSVLSQLVGQG